MSVPDGDNGKRSIFTGIYGDPRWNSNLWGETKEKLARKREEMVCPSLNWVSIKTTKPRRTNLAKPAYHRRNGQRRRYFRATGSVRVAYSQARMASEWHD